MVALAKRMSPSASAQKTPSGFAPSMVRVRDSLWNGAGCAGAAGWSRTAAPDLEEMQPICQQEVATMPRKVGDGCGW